jgi:hypothetical protein
MGESSNLQIASSMASDKSSELCRDKSEQSNQKWKLEIKIQIPGAKRRSMASRRSATIRTKAPGAGRRRHLTSDIPSLTEPARQLVVSAL